MRFIITITACAAVLLVPAAGPSRAVAAPGFARPDAFLELSAAKKRHANKKPAKREEYRNEQGRRQTTGTDGLQ